MEKSQLFEMWWEKFVVHACLSLATVYDLHYEENVKKVLPYRY